MSEITGKTGLQEHQHIQTKNKNERLTREVVEKEQNILELQNQVTALEQENENLTENLELSQAKVNALELFSSELQQKHDQLNLKYRDAQMQINELSNCEVSAKLLEYKRQVVSL